MFRKLNTMTIRTYTELSRLSTFQERYEYLKLSGSVGVATFGFDRYLNQIFYKSAEWRRVRRDVIVRDSGLDLGVEGHEIFSSILVHHMNPIREEEIVARDPRIIDPEFLITTTTKTHNGIHFGSDLHLEPPVVERRPGDTKLW